MNIEDSVKIINTISDMLADMYNVKPKKHITEYEYAKAEFLNAKINGDNEKIDKLRIECENKGIGPD